MEWDKCALVVTSSVYVSAPYTALTDPLLRETQYLEALEFFITQSSLAKIIVCDNSGYRYPESLYRLTTSHKKEIELLSFTGNKELVTAYGKGFGEGEIMAFVMANSKLIQTVTGFLKVTGRLKVVNVDAVLQQCRHDQNYFMPISLLRPRFMVPKAARACVEVRTYYATVAFFNDVLLNAYKQVRDHDVYFLEHAYHDAIASSGIAVTCFPAAPEVTGISGSNGWVMKERSRYKKILIKLVDVLGYIKPVYRK